MATVGVLRDQKLYCDIIVTLRQRCEGIKTFYCVWWELAPRVKPAKQVTSDDYDLDQLNAFPVLGWSSVIICVRQSARFSIAAEQASTC